MFQLRAPARRREGTEGEPGCSLNGPRSWAQRERDTQPQALSMLVPGAELHTVEESPGGQLEFLGRNGHWKTGSLRRE